MQRHAARRLHYDFRLEWDGVLKSWAVPKGPSSNPTVKRLAVEVEDHPVEYGRFEGRVPAGEYGAGEVRIWDRGTWTPHGDVAAGLRKGRLDFDLHGNRLRGRWALVRLHKPDERATSWLLIKARDEFATTSTAEPVGGDEPRQMTPLPRFIAPQLATAAAEAPRHGRWLCELKLDGYRMLVRADGRSVRCYTRNGRDWTGKLSHVASAIGRLQLQASWLDGELVATDTHGQPQFQLLQQRLDKGEEDALTYHAFDLMYSAGIDVRDRPLAERKPLLQKSLAGLDPAGPVRLVDFVEGGSAALLEHVCRERLEGLVVKDVTAPYRSGRTRSWLKLKCRREQEFVIGGYTRTGAGRATLTSLLLGLWDGGHTRTLRFAGRAGTGFDSDALAHLRERLDALAQSDCPFEPEPVLRRGEHPTWVKPVLVAQVRFAGWTSAGLLRQPVFVGLRADKRATAVGPAPEPVARTARPGNRRVTSPQRVVFPHDGVTKAELARYYDGMQSMLWPNLRARPLSIVRATEQGGAFFQRHLQSGRWQGLKALRASDADELPYFACTSPAGLQSLSQIAAVELHTWGSPSTRLDHANRLTFDLDPDVTLPWRAVHEAALIVRELLNELGLQSFLKTTGGKGLHVVVPLTAPLPEWDRAAEFARATAQHLAHILPDRFTSRAGARNRTGRTYVDFQRNRRGATAVAAYSPRFRPGVPVSMPVAWDALGSADLRDAHFNLRNALAQVVDRGADPWEAYPRVRQRLTARTLARVLAVAARR